MGKKIQGMQQGQKKGGKKGNRGLGGKELVKILSEQEKLRKSLQEMAEKAKGQGRKGDLQKAAEEMEEVEKDLAQGRESNYRERLQEIKTRLLESEKAELKRKKKEQRQAEEAQNLSQVDAPAWFQGAQKEETGQEAIRSIPLDLTRFYKERSNTR
jgi:rRNA maturation endonuclease Nob1